MWKVIFSIPVRYALERYIERYREYFVSLYEGGGIWSEESIIDSYIKSSEELQKNIIDYIVKRFSSEILPYQLLADGMRKSVIFVHDRMVFLEYSEKEPEKIRIIEKITIQYK